MQTNLGSFSFRINAKGKVDSTWYRGNLHPDMSDRILLGTCNTEGYWIVKPGTKPTQYAWYVYPFFNVGAWWDKNSPCSPEEKAMQKNIASLSSLVFQLFFQIDPYYNSATMIMPTVLDGTPQL